MTLKTYQIWTKEEIQVLIDNYKTKTSKEIAEILHRTKSSIDNRSFKISKLKKGQKSWNIGIKNPMYGKENKWGHHTYETKEKIRKSNIGKKVSLETGEKIRKWHIGKYHTEETKKKMSLMRKGKKYPIEIYPNRGSRGFVLPMEDSSIEIKLQNFLKALHIEFFTHYWINKIEHKYRCDILIPSIKTIIECDGCYWHGCPICKKGFTKKIKEQIEVDKIRTKELQEKGYRIIRLWEHEIKQMKLNNFKEKL